MLSAISQYTPKSILTQIKWFLIRICAQFEALAVCLSSDIKRGTNEVESPVFLPGWLGGIATRSQKEVHDGQYRRNPDHERESCKWGKGILAKEHVVD